MTDLAWLPRDNELRDHKLAHTTETTAALIHYERRPLASPDGTIVEGLATAWITLDNPGQYPVADRHVVALQGAARRALRTPAQLVQEPSDMIDVIAHPEALLDQLGHPRAGPQIGVKTRRLGALHEQPLKARALSCLELGRASRSRLRPHARLTVDARSRPPPAHAAPIDSDALGDLHGSQSLLEQRQRSQSATLQLLWASGRSHRAPPDQSIGPYLRRHQ